MLPWEPAYHSLLASDFNIMRCSNDINIKHCLYSNLIYSFHMGKHIYKHIYNIYIDIKKQIQWNPSYEATPFAPEK